MSLLGGIKEGLLVYACNGCERSEIDVGELGPDVLRLNGEPMFSVPAPIN